MRHLEEVLRRAAGGTGRAVFLLGESGIGKTRLANEALALARKRGFLTLQGRAYPLAGGLAYSPIVEAVGPYLRSLGAARQSVLLGGLPDLGRLFVGLSLPAPDALGDPALEKTRLFESVSCLIERLARISPIAMFFDDVHSADAATIELLYYLARGLGDRRVLLLTACRATPHDEAQGVRLLLSSLQRFGLAQEIAISRLDPLAVEGLSRAVLGSEPPAKLLELLEARAGGTPLFVEALIRSFIDSGQLTREKGLWTLGPHAAAVLPQTVRDLILERLRRLEAADRQVLDLIAVSGGAASLPVLVEAGDLAETLLIPALRRLLTSGLIDESADGLAVTYQVSHPMVQEVAYAELPALMRRRLHAKFAAALERNGPGDLDRRAYHYRQAGSEADTERASAVLLAAAERAREIHAFLDFGLTILLIEHQMRLVMGIAERIKVLD